MFMKPIIEEANFIKTRMRRPVSLPPPVPASQTPTLLFMIVLLLALFVSCLWLFLLKRVTAPSKVSLPAAAGEIQLHVELDNSLLLRTETTQLVLRPVVSYTRQTTYEGKIQLHVNARSAWALTMYVPTLINLVHSEAPGSLLFEAGLRGKPPLNVGYGIVALGLTQQTIDLVVSARPRDPEDGIDPTAAYAGTLKLGVTGVF